MLNLVLLYIFRKAVTIQNYFKSYARTDATRIERATAEIIEVDLNDNQHLFDKITAGC